MITKQHTIVTTMAIYRLFKSKGFSREEAKALTEAFIKGHISFVLLPDAIRCYIGARQAGHFEKTYDGTDASYMVYPAKDVIPMLTKENAEMYISYYVSPKCITKCFGSEKKVAIGEETRLNVFDNHNANCDYYHEVRTHLLQDICLDKIFRAILINNARMYEDIYVNRATGEEINGDEVRAEATRFEEVGFIVLAGMCYHETGILPTREWFDENVKAVLDRDYDPNMANNTYKYMGISDEVNERFKRGEFSLTDEEIKSVKTANALNETLAQLYNEAIAASMSELESLI